MPGMGRVSASTGGMVMIRTTTVLEGEEPDERHGDQMMPEAEVSVASATSDKKGRLSSLSRQPCSRPQPGILQAATRDSPGPLPECLHVAANRRRQ